MSMVARELSVESNDHDVDSVGSSYKVSNVSFVYVGLLINYQNVCFFLHRLINGLCII